MNDNGFNFNVLNELIEEIPSKIEENSIAGLNLALFTPKKILWMNSYIVTEKETL